MNALELDNGGMLLVGPRRCGKTTVLVSEVQTRSILGEGSFVVTPNARQARLIEDELRRLNADMRYITILSGDHAKHRIRGARGLFIDNIDQFTDGIYEDEFRMAGIRLATAFDGGGVSALPRDYPKPPAPVEIDEGLLRFIWGLVQSGLYVEAGYLLERALAGRD